MTDSYKILGKLATTDIKEHVLYATPSNKSAIISNITVSNSTSSDIAIDINIYDSAISEQDVSSSVPAFIISKQESNIAYYSTDGSSWAQYKTTNQANGSQWGVMAYGANKFIAIPRYRSTGSYSPNGSDWYNFTLPSSKPWSNAVFGVNKFVMVAENQQTGAYSTDGVTWTEMLISSLAQGFKYIEHGNGRFLASDYYGPMIASSTDGIAWTDSELPYYSQWTAPVYSDIHGFFLTVATEANNLVSARSTNGITWTTSSIPNSNYPFLAAYGNGVFLAIASDNALRSTDGISWTQVSLPEYAGWTSAKYGNGRFLIAGMPESGEGITLASSTDGITWTSPTRPSTSGYQNNPKILFGTPDYLSPQIKSLYSNVTVPANDSTVIDAGIALNSNNTIVVKAQSGINFMTSGVELEEVDKYKILGKAMSSSSGTDKRVYEVPSATQSITRGINITNYGLSPTTFNLSIIDNNDLVTTPLIVGVTTSNSSKAIYSTNSVEWTVSALPETSNWKAITYGQGKFAAISAWPSAVASSTDGIEWTLRTPPESPKEWSAIKYGAGKFVAIAAYSDVYAYSTDTITWTTSMLPTYGNWNSITYANTLYGGIFVALASQSTNVARSTDGISWTLATLPSSSNWRKLTYGNGVFVAMSKYSSDLARSTDAVTWTSATLPKGQETLAYGNGIFATTGAYTTEAFSSTDGITWTARTMPSDSFWNTLVHDGQAFVAFASSYPSKVARSTDMVTWSEISLPEGVSWISSAQYVSSVSVSPVPANSDYLYKNATILPKETITIKGAYGLQPKNTIILKSPTSGVIANVFGMEI